MRRFLATPITSHEVVDATMNGEGEVSHHLSEYFGSCRGGVGTGALASVPAQIRKGYSLTVSGVACSGSTAATPAPSFGLCPAQAACNLLPAVLGSEVGKRTGRRRWHERDIMGSPATVPVDQQRADRANAHVGAASCGTVECIDERCTSDDTQDPSALQDGSA
jgi:hypothetical protein